MKNIVWTRIDDRLIHGQVMTQWIQYTSANEVLIIDDGVAKDSFLQMVMKSSVPKTINLEVRSVEEAVDYLKDDSKSEKIIILVKTPIVLDELANNGIDFELINVGGIGAKAGRKSMYKNISVSEDEKTAFRNLVDKGVNVFFRVVTTDPQEDIKKYL
ncbi:PTS system mannose/fructose/N-acetylgalactosamine-transporter subunit IIB [Breznakia pachnodae]|uniref:PTS system mannose-specific IIB component n=1 Tax=Breznakia pachnodae TaxID=265178 RepID=A0ABU0E8I5_9FIRM|nr:PTS sugar transporter subunit IIB [Breznakia pachnodae]MDQ0363209.1 PTS system mannose-specific IIB component [Breznakia pachnodae]